MRIHWTQICLTVREKLAKLQHVRYWAQIFMKGAPIGIGSV